MAGSRGVCRVSVVWCDGRIGERQESGAPNPSVWGAFTTAGCDHGRPILWPRHSRRLSASLVVLGANDTAKLPSENELCELLEVAGLDGPARLRVVVRRIESSLWEVVASARSCDAVGPELRPARLVVQRWSSAPPLAGHKTLARMAWDLARERAQQAGCDDVLLLDSADKLLETSVANLWVVKDGSVRTPLAPDHCLPGVMREWLLENLSRAGIIAAACDLTHRDLVKADEIWISNAVIGVRRVGAVGDQRWGEWPRFDLLDNLGIPAPGW